MYDHVLMKLPEAVVISVRNLINEIQPGANDAYERLKERLKERLTDSYAKTRWQQAFTLIKHPDLGDRRPSALMDEMLALLPTGAHSDDTIFLALSLLRLPTSMRDHLAAADHKTAADMARHADTIWDSRTGETAVAAVSVFPHRSSAAPSGPPLTGADGRSIPSWGSIKKTLSFGLRTFICSFFLAVVSKPILGVDFLAANRLLVDPFSRQVLDSETLLPITPSVSAPPRHSRLAAALCHVAPAVCTLISSFPTIVGDGSGTPNPKHGIRHSIETTGRPIFAKARRLDPEKHRIAEAEFRSLEKAGIVRRSNSPWASPLHMVKVRGLQCGRVWSAVGGFFISETLEAVTSEV